MTVVNQGELLKLAPFDPMFDTKMKAHGVSFGLSEAGYDVRIAETITYTPPVPFWTLIKKYLTSSNEGVERMYRGYITIEHSDGTKEEHLGNFCLASTIEKWKVPTTVLQYIKDKSSHIRRGYHVGNTVAEPGWEGTLTLELFFFSQEKVIIPAGSGIAQVLSHTLMVPHQYDGKYQNQASGPQQAIFN